MEKEDRIRFWTKTDLQCEVYFLIYYIFKEDCTLHIKILFKCILLFKRQCQLPGLTHKLEELENSRNRNKQVPAFHQRTPQTYKKKSNNINWDEGSNTLSSTWDALLWGPQPDAGKCGRSDRPYRFVQQAPPITNLW